MLHTNLASSGVSAKFVAKIHPIIVALMVGGVSGALLASLGLLTSEWTPILHMLFVRPRTTVAERDGMPAD